MLKITDNVPVAEWYSVKKMMKTNFGFVVMDATSGIALHATSCRLKTVFLMSYIAHKN